MGELGDLSTGDVGRYHGHLYAAKAPGLAMVSLPAFGVVQSIGMRTTGDTTRVIWALHLWSIVLPYLAILLLVRMLGDRVQPGYGTAAAVIAGSATLLLPFGTLFFSHALSTALGFGAFAVLWRERDGTPSLRLLAAAGLLAGLAVTAEYPLVFVAAILALYAAGREERLRRLAAYLGGVLLGVLPLLAFDTWAFRNPFHIANEDYFASPGHGTGGTPLGLGVPRLHDVYDLLFSTMGLLILCPVVACGALGTVLLLRGGRRAEALVIAAVGVAYLLYPSGLRSTSPFGGLGPPRYLITMLPFFAACLAPALRAFPRTTLALAAISGFQMAVQTATGPLAAYDGRWLERARAHELGETAAAVVEVTGWSAMLLFFVALLLAAGLTLLVTPRLWAPVVEAGAAALGLLAWAAFALAAPHPTGARPGAGYVVGIVIAAGLFALVASARGGGGLRLRRPAAAA